LQIPLSKAPRIFFDHDKWTEYVGHFDNEETALMHLSSPPGIDFSWWKDSLKPDETVRLHKERLFALKMALVQAFYRRLKDGSIIATGKSFNSVEPTPIAPSQWLWLWPAYASDRAIGPDIHYSDVMLSANAQPRSRSAELTERCEMYLRSQYASGEIPKKEIIRNQVDSHFGIKVPVRAFNKAYRNVFSRTRGRPSK
jgi:hypothetical protein